MNSYAHVWRLVFQEPWAILPDKLEVIAELVRLRAAGGRYSEDEVRERIGAAGPPRAGAAGRNGSIAVMDLFGVLAQRVGPMEEMSGATGTESFGQAFKQVLADPGVGSVILNVDSPGGQVTGAPELADLIFQSRGDKPIVAVANSMAASAAYWIASAADELVVTPSGEVGSIGVVAIHEETSKMADAAGVTRTILTAGKYKWEANPYQPLGADAQAALQARVDDYYGMFTRTVARNRGTSAAAVQDGYGQGRVVGAKEAVKLGMADRVDTLDGTIARLAKGGYHKPRRGAGAEDPPYRIVTSDSTEGHVLPSAERFSDGSEEEEQVDSTPHTEPPAADDGDLERRHRRMRLAQAGAGVLTG